MKFVIAAAMEEELAPFRTYYRRERYLERGKTIVETVLTEENIILFLVETGIGKVNAAAATSILCETIQPDMIINTGSAGGFSECLNIGDVVFATNSIYSDVDATGFNYSYGQVPQMPKNYMLGEKWLTYFDKLSAPDYQLYQGLVVTADSFMNNNQLIKQTKKHFPKVVASDMESTAITQVAHFYQIPVLNIRGISDIVGKEAATLFNQNINLASLHAFEQVKIIVNLLVDNQSF